MTEAEAATVETTAEERPRLRVVYLHGLEGGPQGAKPVFLSRFFDTHVPYLNAANPFACVLAAIRAIHAVRPHVVVGSSFGAAVLQWLLQRGEWHGPSLLLAPALGLALPFSRWLPPASHALIVHGVHDVTVPLAYARDLVVASTTAVPLLAEGSDAPTRGVELIEVDDGHKLTSLLDEASPNNLRELVLRLHRESSGVAPENLFPASSGFQSCVFLALQIAWQLPLSFCMHGRRLY